VSVSCGQQLRNGPAQEAKDMWMEEKSSSKISLSSVPQTEEVEGQLSALCLHGLGEREFELVIRKFLGEKPRLSGAWWGG